MGYGFRVMAVSIRSEREIYRSSDLIDACQCAMSRNRSPYTTLYIVERPEGVRIPIAGQRDVLGGEE